MAVLAARNVPFVTAKVWTTDALYRETRGKVARRVAEGCVAVDMEASALFAVARFRGVRIAHILAAADDLSQEQWDDRGFIPDTGVRERLFWLAVEACAALGAELTPPNRRGRSAARMGRSRLPRARRLRGNSPHGERQRHPESPTCAAS